MDWPKACMYSQSNVIMPVSYRKVHASESASVTSWLPCSKDEKLLNNLIILKIIKLFNSFSSWVDWIPWQPE